MLIYAGTKSDFMVDTENDRLETKLYENTYNLICYMNGNTAENIIIYFLFKLLKFIFLIVTIYDINMYNKKIQT